MKKQFKNNTLETRQNRDYMLKGVSKSFHSAINNETPFKVIKIDSWEIRLYWTKNSGVYGYQVIAVVWGDYYEHLDGLERYSYKTGGCGYCKESSAVEHCFRQIGIKPKNMILGSSSIDHNYRIGGNFYSVPLKDIRKVK